LIIPTEVRKVYDENGSLKKKITLTYTYDGETLLNITSVEGSTEYTPPLGIIAWYDASDDSTLYQNSGLSSLVTADGDPVGGWKDKSGYNLHITQSNSSKRGVFESTSIMNGLPCVVFDGVDDFLTTATGLDLSSTTEAEIWLVSYTTRTTASQLVIESYSTNGFHIAYDDVLGSGHFDDIYCLFKTNASTQYNSQIHMGTRAPHIIRAVIDTTQSSTNKVKTYIDNLTDGPYETWVGSGTNTGNLTNHVMTVGSASASTFPFEGGIGEILIFNRKLTTDEVNELNDYLEEKWISNNITDVSGIKFWLDASDITKLYTDDALTSQVDADGDVIGGWKDKSGANIHVKQSTSGNKPLFNLTNSNFHNKPSIVFDGTNDHLVSTTNLDLSGTNIIDVWMVGYGSSASAQITLEQSANSDTGPGFVDAIRNNFTYASHSENNSGMKFNEGYKSSSGNGNPHIHRLIHDKTQAVVEIRVFIDNYEYSITSGIQNNTTLNFPSDIISVGARSGGTYPFSGGLGEIIIFDNIISAYDRARVRTYLRKKWGAM
jgi:hypothetical protein